MISKKFALGLGPGEFIYTVHIGVLVHCVVPKPMAHIPPAHGKFWFALLVASSEIPKLTIGFKCWILKLKSPSPCAFECHCEFSAWGEGGGKCLKIHGGGMGGNYLETPWRRGLKFLFVTYLKYKF